MERKQGISLVAAAFFGLVVLIVWWFAPGFFVGPIEKNVPTPKENTSVDTEDKVSRQQQVLRQKEILRELSPSNPADTQAEKNIQIELLRKLHEVIIVDPDTVRFGKNVSSFTN